jgi:hypothetical protein
VAIGTDTRALYAREAFITTGLPLQIGTDGLSIGLFWPSQAGTTMGIVGDDGH